MQSNVCAHFDCDHYNPRVEKTQLPIRKKLATIIQIICQYAEKDKKALTKLFNIPKI